MKPPCLSPLFFRRIHKWVGMILGIQVVLWTVSGAMMALLDSDKVGSHGGHQGHAPAPITVPSDVVGPKVVSAGLGGAPITGLSLRPMLGRYVYEVRTPDGLRLVDAVSGRPVKVDAELARSIAEADYIGAGAVRAVSRVPEPTLETREHDGATWRIDFADADDTSFYVSAASGKIVERRNNSWRIWDFFWMLHNMDYLERKSFNHPLIITIAFGVVWLSTTGFYLLFKSFRKSDFRWVTGAAKRLRARRRTKAAV